MADFSVYPNAIDGYAQLPLVVDTVTRVDAVTVNRLRDAIVKIEAELGILPSSEAYATVRERLDELESILASLDTPGLGYKNPARVAVNEPIANLTSGAPRVVDGITLAEGDRVLVYGQTTDSENGIYEVDVLGTGSNGSWVRAADANLSSRLIPGSEIFITEGTSGGCKFWLTTPGPIDLGTTSLEFVGGLNIMKGDSEPTQVLSANPIGLGRAAATATDSFSVQNFKEVDLSFTTSNLHNITSIRVQILYSLLSSPGNWADEPGDWNFLLSEEITSGLAVVDVYTLQLDATTYPGFDDIPGSFAVRFPASGLHMMALIWSESGASALSSWTAKVLRRI